MAIEFIALGGIIAVALYLFWTQKVRTDMTALLVTLALILPWPHPPDWKWQSILTYQEGFSGFGSVAVVMVVAMFVFGAAIVRTGAAEFLGTSLFRACALYFLLLGRKCLPKGETIQSEEDKLARQYLTEVLVTPGSATIGKKLGELDWAKRSDLTVLEVIRGSKSLHAASGVTLQAGD